MGVKPITRSQKTTDADVKNMMRRGVRRLSPKTMVLTVVCGAHRKRMIRIRYKVLVKAAASG